MRGKPGLKASYSVETAWVFGISLMVIYMVIALSFFLYSDTCEYIDSVSSEEVNAVKVFRAIQNGEEIWD